MIVERVFLSVFENGKRTSLNPEVKS